jgi:hypothetical protein
MSDHSSPPAGRGAAGALLFVENVGQWDARIRFAVMGGRPQIRLTTEAVWFTLVEPIRTEPLQPHSPALLTGTMRPTPPRAVHLRLSFPGAQPHVLPQPLARLPSLVSYLRGTDQAAWHPGVPAWSGVVYPELYPGVQLYMQGRSGQMEWRVEAATHSALDTVRLRIEGADRVRAVPQPDNAKPTDSPCDSLLIITPVGSVTLPLIGSEGQRTGQLAVEQGSAQAFDVVSPFTYIRTSL